MAPRLITDLIDYYVTTVVALETFLHFQQKDSREVSEEMSIEEEAKGWLQIALAGARG